jgi:hypothetical protein
MIAYRQVMVASQVMNFVVMSLSAPFSAAKFACKFNLPVAKQQFTYKTVVL